MNGTPIHVLISFGHCVLLEFYTTKERYNEIRERIAGWKNHNGGCVLVKIQNEEYDVNPDFVQLQRVKPVEWKDIPENHRRAIQATGSSLIRFVEGGGIYVKQSEA